MPGAATSRIATLLTALAVIAGVALLVANSGAPRGTIVSAAAGGLLGIAVLLRTRESASESAVASAFAPVVATATVGALALSILDAGAGAVFTGDANLPAVIRSAVAALGASAAAGFGAFGTVGTLRDGIGDGAVAAFLRSTVATLVVVGIGLAAIVVPRFDALSSLPVPTVDLAPFLDPILSPFDPGVGLVTFWLLVVALGGAASGALDALPIVELAARGDRDRVASALERLDSILDAAIKFAALLALLSAGAVATGVLSRLLVTVPVIRSVLVVLATPGLRVLLVGSIAVLGGVGVAIGVLQRITGSATDAVRAALPAIPGGILASLAAVPLSTLLVDLRAALPSSVRGPVGDVFRALTPLGVALAVIAGALFVLTGLLAVVVLAGVFEYVPSRAGGGAIAAAGLVVGAVSVGAVGGSPLVVFAVVALAILTWDAGERGVATRAELGPEPGTSVEVVHTLGSFTTATLGIGIAWILSANVLGAVAVPGGTLVGLTATVVAAVVLLGVLRG